ncbi:MAG: hypothetical protein ACI9E1_000184 [Cryomorphaceae bacterium]|jgi:uncharacterized protein (DUF58 family)
MDTLDERVFTSLQALNRLQYKSRGFSFLPRQPIHSLLAGKHASKLRGRGLNFEELRGYLPGDDIRTMDWKATLRTRKPIVRAYSEERDRPAYIVVDQRRSMFFGSQFKMKSVIAAELAAVCAWRSLDQGDRVGAIIFNDEGFIEIKPNRSRKTVQQILGEIVRQNHALKSHTTSPTNSQILNRVLEHVSRVAHHDGLICVITDMLGADAESRRLMTKLARHNDVIVGFVYDPLEEELPESGKMVFSKGDSQLQVDTSDRQLREGYATAFVDRLAKARKILIQRAVPLVSISTADDPVKQIQSQLGYARSDRSAT